jgi:chromatin segregation and condensation protein Rec8/ScpA/Scc1 (kleisin family)
LALLELIRMKQLVCSQSEAFGEIEVSRAPATAAAMPAAETAPAETSPQSQLENPQSV